MGLLTPFTDIFQADVAGSKAYKGLYWVLVAFGTLIFLNGVINSGTTFGDLITTTEILLPQSQVNFPVVFGCIEDEIFEEGGEDIAFEGENNCRENCKASVTGGAGAATEVKIGFYGELKGFPPGTPEKKRRRHAAEAGEIFRGQVLLGGAPLLCRQLPPRIQARV